LACPNGTDRNPAGHTIEHVGLWPRANSAERPDIGSDERKAVADDIKQGAVDSQTKRDRVPDASGCAGSHWRLSGPTGTDRHP
jgi:hypothetical protein